MALAQPQLIPVSRGSGRSCVAAAAYISGQDLYDERQGEPRSYTKRLERILHTEILVPAHAPDWMANRQELWTAVDKAETAFNRKASCARTAFEWRVLLPKEFTAEQAIECNRSFLMREFVEKRGLVVDSAVHLSSKVTTENGGNPHAHNLITTRAVEADGFSRRKHPDLDQRAFLLELRQLWPQHVNRHLEMAGIETRVDIRSHEERGTGLMPEPKQGPVATQMERDGKDSFAGADRRRIKNANDNRVRNAELTKLRAENAKKVGNVSDLADSRREEVDAEELRRARDEATTREHMQREDEERKRQGQAASYLDDIETKTKEQLKNLEAMRDARDTLSPAEILRREYATRAEKDQKFAQASISQIERDRELAKEANDDKGNAHLRYAQALGRAQGTDWLSRSMSAVAKEGEMAATEHRKMLDDMKKQDDPLKREIIWQNIVIHHAEYRIMVDSRMAGQSDYIAGKPYLNSKSGLENGKTGSENGNAHRAMVKKWEQDADAARKLRNQLVRQDKEEFLSRLKEANLEEARKKEDEKARSQMNQKRYPPYGHPPNKQQNQAAPNPTEAKIATGQDDSLSRRQAADIKRQQTEQSGGGAKPSTWRAPTQEERANAKKESFQSGTSETAKSNAQKGWEAPSRPDAGNSGGGQTGRGGTRGR